jgi:hypothetical protein
MNETKTNILQPTPSTFTALAQNALQVFQNNRLAKQYGFKFQIHQEGKEVINNIEQSNNTDLF